MTIKSIFAGFGGQGVLMMGYLLALAGMRQGNNVTYLPSYGAEVRGGTANCTVAVSNEEISSPVSSSPDYIIAMNTPSLVKFAYMVKDSGAILINSSLVQTKLLNTINNINLNIIDIPATDLAHDLGVDRSANMVMLGGLAEILTNMISINTFKEALGETALSKKPKILELNRHAIEIGAQNVRKILKKELKA